MYLLYTIVLHFICWLIHFFRSKIVLYNSVPVCNLTFYVDSKGQVYTFAYGRNP